MDRSGLLVGLIFVGGLMFVGCQSEPATHPVKGKIHKGGTPLAVKEVGGMKIGILRVWLAPVESGKGNFDAQISPDGSFVFGGAKGRGVPPGKYKVCAFWSDKGALPTDPDLLNGKFSESKTKILVDVPLTADLEINVAN